MILGKNDNTQTKKKLECQLKTHYTLVKYFETNKIILVLGLLLFIILKKI